MKKTVLSIVFIIFTVFPLCGQNIVGDWSGLTHFKNGVLKIVFHIQKTDSGYSATWDTPYQNGYDLLVDTILFENKQLTLICNESNFKYYGTLSKKGDFNGTFIQRGKYPLFLTQGEKLRPQEPKKPYPYTEEEVTFDNPMAPGVTLAGTLTLPKNQKAPCPAVILVSGSGPQNRDSELFGHRIFLVISDYLTRNGIAVLRYDDRGVFGSTGTETLDTCTSYDFSLDTEAAFNYLKTNKNINPEQIGIIGHSEGGMIAPMVAARNKEVAFIVLLAGPGMRIDSLMYLQNKLNYQHNKLSKQQIDYFLLIDRQCDSLIINIHDTIVRKEKLTELITQKLGEDNMLGKQKLALYTSKWYQYFINYHPAITLEQVKCPVLALNGEKDYQVPPKENLSAIHTALSNSGNGCFETKEMKKLNHLFQTCETGAGSEYAKIEETFSPKALKVIGKWIKKRTK